MNRVLQPPGWAKPSGYANGIEASGRLVFVGGQVGWNSRSEFETDDFLLQLRQTLHNVVTILAEANAEPAHLVSMTWYLTEKGEYQENLKSVGQIYREIIGPHYPAMAVVQVRALVEARAKIEIQAVAVIP